MDYTVSGPEGRHQLLIRLQFRIAIPPGDSIRCPNLSVPNLSVPNLSVPNLSVPNLSVPNLSVPNFSVINNTPSSHAPSKSVSQAPGSKHTHQHHRQSSPA